MGFWSDLFETEDERFKRLGSSFYCYPCLDKGIKSLVKNKGGMHNVCPRCGEDKYDPDDYKN